MTRHFPLALAALCSCYVHGMLAHRDLAVGCNFAQLGSEAIKFLHLQLDIYDSAEHDKMQLHHDLQGEAALPQLLPRLFPSSTDIVIVGALLMVLKTVVVISGMVLMRYASLGSDAQDLSRTRLLGMLMVFVLAPVTEACAYAYAPQSLLAPINGLDLIWNILLSPFLLNEHLDGARVVGTMLVFLGSVIAPIAGPHKTSTLKLEDLQDIFVSARFLVYSMVCIALMIFGAIELKRRQPQVSGKSDPVRGMLLAVGGGALAGQNCFLRATAALVNSSSQSGDWRAWVQPLPWLIIAGLVLCLIANAALLNIGLAEFEAIFIVPLFAGSGIVVSCVSAAVVMHETSDLAVPRLAGYWFGITLVMVGIFLLVGNARAGNAEDSVKLSQSSPKDCSSSLQ
eukprot:TRINITY_DN92448_c0_g1_i1.p1 TRINITY_DN92448_c0_g1~~TRINITY_DN92448_c0_g1_i1.p1  ORF type:complete len:397 (-),score=42.76 TRINITY_DN92448_c0_g1_i1:163-1353(-)